MKTLDVTPVAKPRMTRSDKWKQRPAVMRYRVFCDELRAAWGPIEVPDTLRLVFYVQMPASWSTKKKIAMDGKPHQQRPDIDNFLKAFLDALCEDDAHVWSVKASKVWGQTASIEVDVIK